MTAAPSRTRLPNRRPLITESLSVGGQAIEASVGFDPATGRPRELFLSGAKDGTDLAAILDDASVVLSVPCNMAFRLRPWCGALPACRPHRWRRSIWIRPATAIGSCRHP